MNFNIFFWT